MPPDERDEGRDVLLPHEFEAPIERFGVGKSRKIWYDVLFLPPAIEAVLPFERLPRLRVVGEIAEVPIENAFIPTGDGRRYVIVSPEVKRTARVGRGDVVEMRFRIADQDHVDVPDALARAVAAKSTTRTAWAALTPGRRRALAQHVKAAKTAPTIRRRVEEAVQALIEHGGDLRKWRAAR